MAGPRRKHPVGHVPFDRFTTGGDNLYWGTKVGIITYVDEVNMKANVRVITGASDRFELDLTQGMAGARSFWGGVPEEGSVCIIGYRRVSKQIKEAVILGYIPVGTKSGARFDPFSPVDPDDIDEGSSEAVEDLFGKTRRYKRLMLKPGDVGGMSSKGSELILNENVTLTNRAGDFMEFRDAERAIITSTVHRIDSVSGVRIYSGPVRRSAFYLPDDILREGSRVLKDEGEGYYGRDELQTAGSSIEPGEAPNYALSDGTLLETFNNYTTFPPTVLGNGRYVYYPPTVVGEDIEVDDAIADTYVEHRLELSQTSNANQEVLEEIDGFRMDRRRAYIEHVLGTVVGYDYDSLRGQRQYAQVLKPRIFTDFNSRQRGRFSMELCKRQATEDYEQETAAGAFLFRIRPPRNSGEDAFVTAVSKQGKLFVNVPSPSVEDYPSGAKNVSAEVNMAGALKAFLGASFPNNISLDLTCLGGIRADLGHTSTGNAVEVTYRSGVKTTVATTTPNDSGVASEENVQGTKRVNITGLHQEQAGRKHTIVDGAARVDADRVETNAHSGLTQNCGELSCMVSGKSQYNYALQVLENIVLGGKVTTVLAGGLVTTVAAGAITTTAAAGAIAMSAAAGAVSVAAGAAVSITAGAGATMTATGALGMTAGGVLSMTASGAISATAVSLTVNAAQVMIGSPAAAFGVARGTPMMPPGSPSLDWITGLPLQGSASFRSLL